MTKGAETVVSGQSVYPFWTYNGTVPGPFIRTRVGDTLDVVLKNEDDTPHNVDLHACHAPGGGAAATDPPSLRRRRSPRSLPPSLGLFPPLPPPPPPPRRGG